MKVKVITDSTSYIPADLREELGITEIPLSVSFPDEQFLETEVDYDYYYHKIETGGVIPTSSQPSSGEMVQRFRKILDQGHDILAIFLSSLMSGTHEAAMSAREQLLKEYPEAQITILDSKTNSMSLGYPVLEAARAAAKGLPLHQISEMASDLIQRMHFYFTPASLEYLKKGGRIGGAAALLGKVIKFRPILFVDNGSANVFRVSRNFRGAIDEMMKVLDRDYHQRGIKEVIVHHINFPEKAHELGEMIKQRYGIAASILPIGPVVGMHVGPGTIGLVYCTER
ncbi:MAG: DegV family protein [Coriobacteriales bacterium]|jgi:DegV family protein with EDD domain|nr:DegV family protein [Coriobacteriales bacterium]